MSGSLRSTQLYTNAVSWKNFPSFSTTSLPLPCSHKSISGLVPGLAGHPPTFRRVGRPVRGLRAPASTRRPSQQNLVLLKCRACQLMLWTTPGDYAGHLTDSGQLCLVAEEVAGEHGASGRWRPL